jgi:hypothetical protein
MVCNADSIVFFNRGQQYSHFCHFRVVYHSARENGVAVHDEAGWRR